MYKICIYVPGSHVEEVKNAMFISGAGKIGNYAHCAWQMLGEGQFMPLTGSHAYSGELDRLERVAEYKIEMVCEDNVIHDVVTALKKAHPYEEPAYQIWKIESF